jgi:8-oxo-dGTP diphosphatase
MYADLPDRDPRGRTISFIFAGIIASPFPEIRGGDDASGAAWYPFQKLPRLAFDHDDIIRRSWKKLEPEFYNSFLLAAFLPNQFELSELEKLFMKIFPDSEGSSDWLKNAIENNMIKRVNQNRFERIESAEVLYSTLLRS